MNDDFLSSAQFQSPAEDSWLGSLGRGVAGQGFSWNAAVSTKPHLCPTWQHILEVRPAGKNLHGNCFSGGTTTALVPEEAVAGVVRKEGLAKTKLSIYIFSFSLIPPEWIPKVSCELWLWI